jgi:uncharacterized OB-fold protein
MPTPLPTPDPVTKPFWDSLKAHRIQLQHCTACDKFVYYPRAVCPACMGTELVWTDVSGRGVIHAFTIPHRHPNPEFKVPYVVVLVELEEGVRMLSNLVEVEPVPEAVSIGARVEIVYDDVSDGITLPRFRLAGS